MTCIVAVKTDEHLYMGGDSAGVSGDSIRVRADSKVFAKKDPDGQSMLFGFTTSFRMGQIIQYGFSIPKKPKGVPPHRYMCTLFVDELVKLFENKKYLKISDNQAAGGTFIVGYHNQLFTLYDDFQVAQPQEPYDSVGCGSDHALAALYGLSVSSLDLSPTILINTALDAASYFSTGVCKPYKIISTAEVV